MVDKTPLADVFPRDDSMTARLPWWEVRNLRNFGVDRGRGGFLLSCERCFLIGPV
jgi:hypothetical protein